MNNIMPQCYITGGAVRDTLLRLEPKDIDYVWTGITPEFLLSAGYKQVGASFPVFLDHEGNEHALARTERKTGVGYHGFEVEFNSSITIEQDLERRDCTFNSMAVNISDWDEFSNSRDTNMVIDPFHGISDLHSRVIRHTSFAFCQDPIRVLRVARFSARYGYNVDAKTLELMEAIAPELNHVPTERIWQELSKGLMERYPDRMFNVLQECGALDIDIMKPFNKFSLNGLHKTNNDIIPIKFALCAIGFQNNDYDTLSIPNDCKNLSKLLNNHINDLYKYSSLSPEEKLKIFTNCHAFNNLDNLNLLLHTFELISDNDIRYIVLSDIHKLNQISIQEIIESCSTGQEIKEKLYNKRIGELHEK